MNNLGDDFMKAFSQRLPDFFEFFKQCWWLEKMKNNSFDGLTQKDWSYWFFMQFFAETRINQFAKTLPAEGQKFSNSIQKEMTKRIEKTH